MENIENIENVQSTQNTIEKIEMFIKSGNYTKAALIADKNTFAAGGQAVWDILGCTSVKAVKHIYNEDHLLPDEAAVGSLIMALDPNPELIIALGAGTVNDLCRFAASRLKADYISVPTAASMDGYASGVAAMITGMQKETYPAVTPKEIFADYSIYRTAPDIMNTAGFGDVIGKHTSLTDWHLSNIINGEAYDDGIADMVHQAVDICLGVAERLRHGDEHALKAQMEALLLSGTAMKLAGSSRPASGAEHHLAHFYEAAGLKAGKKPLLHGIYVAQSTWTVLRLHELLLDHETVIKNKYREKWPEIRHVLENSAPNKIPLRELCTLLSCPLSPSDIGINRDTFVKSVTEAMFIRPRYTVLRMSADLNLLDKFAQIMADEFF